MEVWTASSNWLPASQTHSQLHFLTFPDTQTLFIRSVLTVKQAQGSDLPEMTKQMNEWQLEMRIQTSRHPAQCLPGPCVCALSPWHFWVMATVLDGVVWVWGSVCTHQRGSWSHDRPDWPWPPAVRAGPWWALEPPCLPASANLSARLSDTPGERARHFPFRAQPPPPQNGLRTSLLGDVSMPLTAMGGVALGTGPGTAWLWDRQLSSQHHDTNLPWRVGPKGPESPCTKSKPCHPSPPPYPQLL